MVLTTGLRLHDRYTLDQRIGRGGMSEVWRATDEVLGRAVAVKVLAPYPDAPIVPGVPIVPELPAASPGESMPANPAAGPWRAATRREAMAAARLTHPNVTQVYDYGEAVLTGGVVVPYLVMELVDGQNLAERLAQGPLPWPAAARVAAQVAAGLEAAHRLGVVHLDVKPGNVMLTATGAKILDFGIAALVGARPEDGGWLVGTPAYAAPERLKRGEAHPAADVYGLGALLYRSLTGQSPIAIGSWTEAAEVHEREPAVPEPEAPGVPAAVSALCLACLAREPADRPAARQVVATLNAALGAGADGAAVGAPAGEVAAVGAPAGEMAVGPIGTPAHPRTLIDRSAAAAQRARSVAPRRIAASAAVPPRRAPDAAAPGPRPPGGGRPPRSRLALVGVTGGITAAGLALILVAAAFTPDGGTGTTSAAPSISAPQASGAGGAPAAAPTTPAAPTSPSPGPDTAAGIFDEIEVILSDAVTAGQMSEEVAEDLHDDVADLRKRVGDGKRKGLRKKIDDLRDEIGDAIREDALAVPTALRLQAVLLRLLSIEGEGRGVDEGPRGGGRGDDDDD